MTGSAPSRTRGRRLTLAIPVALVAGLVSFFSPCVVPLLPGCISYVTGLAGADLDGRRRGRMLAGTGLLVLGFSFVFVSLGTLMGVVGTWFLTNQRTLSVILGVVVVVMGFAFLRAVPFLQRDLRVHASPMSESPPHRCWGCFSASAGRPASAPP